MPKLPWAHFDELHSPGPAILSPESPDIPDITAVQEAHRRIRHLVCLTPVLACDGLSAALGCELLCKCEHLQFTGSFKFRGASNAVARLREAGIGGDVATHSSGNHGSALALAARMDGRTAHVVMPENASALKVDAVRLNGGVVHYCPPSQADRESGLAKLVQAGHLPIPPYDHFDIIAGQGTAALELLDSNTGLDVLIAPVGGGGLVAGSALVASDRGISTYAAEPAGAADTAESIAAGHRVSSVQPNTIADGLRALVGERNFLIIQRLVSGVLTVEDADIRTAMALFWRYTRMLIEPSSAVVIAAIRRYPHLFADKKVGVIISGANIHPRDWLALTEAVE
jgi:threonine dehydratase